MSGIVRQKRCLRSRLQILQAPGHERGENPEPHPKSEPEMCRECGERSPPAHFSFTRGFFSLWVRTAMGTEHPGQGKQTSMSRGSLSLNRKCWAQAVGGLYIVPGDSAEFGVLNTHTACPDMRTHSDQNFPLCFQGRKNTLDSMREKRLGWLCLSA